MSECFAVAHADFSVRYSRQECHTSNKDTVLGILFPSLEYVLASFLLLSAPIPKIPSFPELLFPPLALPFTNLLSQHVLLFFKKQNTCIPCTFVHNMKTK